MESANTAASQPLTSPPTYGRYAQRPNNATLPPPAQGFFVGVGWGVPTGVAVLALVAVTSAAAVPVSLAVGVSAVAVGVVCTVAVTCGGGVIGVRVFEIAAVGVTLWTSRAASPDISLRRCRKRSTRSERRWSSLKTLSLIHI